MESVSKDTFVSLSLSLSLSAHLTEPWLRRHASRSTRQTHSHAAVVRSQRRDIESVQALRRAGSDLGDETLVLDATRSEVDAVVVKQDGAELLDQVLDADERPLEAGHLSDALQRAHVADEADLLAGAIRDANVSHTWRCVL